MFFQLHSTWKKHWRNFRNVIQLAKYAQIYNCCMCSKKSLCDNAFKIIISYVCLVWCHLSNIWQISIIVSASHVLAMAVVWMELIHTRAPVKKVILVTSAKQVSSCVSSWHVVTFKGENQQLQNLLICNCMKSSIIYMK